MPLYGGSCTQNLANISEDAFTRANVCNLFLRLEKICSSFVVELYSKMYFKTNAVTKNAYK